MEQVPGCIGKCPYFPPHFSNSGKRLWGVFALWGVPALVRQADVWASLQRDSSLGPNPPAQGPSPHHNLGPEGTLQLEFDFSAQATREICPFIFMACAKMWMALLVWILIIFKISHCQLFCILQFPINVSLVLTVSTFCTCGSFLPPWGSLWLTSPSGGFNTLS